MNSQFKLIRNLGYEEEYEWVREYNYKILPENDTYFMTFKNGYVYYNSISHRVNLTKAKQSTSVRIST